MMKSLCYLMIVGIMICSLTSCAVFRERQQPGCTLHLNLRYDGTLPQNLDVYVDGAHVCKIIDPKSPNPLVLQRGLHKVRVASDDHHLEGITEIYILGQGREQRLRVDIIKVAAK